MQYIFVEGDDYISPKILVKRFDKVQEEVLEDVLTVLSITVTENTLMCYDDSGITVISPANYTWYGIRRNVLGDIKI